MSAKIAGKFLNFCHSDAVASETTSPSPPFSIGYLNVKAGVVKMFLYLWRRTPKLDQLAGELSAVEAIFSWVFCHQVELRLQIKLWVFEFR
jgi:hypothetical protein